MNYGFRYYSLMMVANVVTKKILKLFKKRDDRLKNKFENLELELQNSNNQDDRAGQNYAQEEEKFFEEEVLWWTGDSALFESIEADERFESVDKVLRKLKKTNLYYKIAKIDSLSLETVKDKKESYILMTWDSDFMDLAERRKQIEQIRHFQISFRSMGIKVQLVHNHKRLGLSTNLGVKIKVDQVEVKNRGSVLTRSGEKQV